MATGTPSRPSAQAFHAADVEQTGEYRSLSVLALVALVFGLLSPLCFAGPLLLAIPIFGLAISILALRRIALSEGALAGRWAAVCGLVLCLTFTVAPFTRDFALRVMRSHQAEEFGRKWIALLLSGHADEAFRLTLEGARPQMPDPAAPTPKTTPYDTFSGLPVVKALVAAGADADVHFGSTLEYERQASRAISVRQQFEVMPTAKDSSGNPPDHPVNVILSMRRGQLPGEGRSRWLVSTVDSATTPTGAGAK